MNKIFSKTVRKTTLLSVIIAVILAAAIVIGALFGFNADATAKDSSTLTVTVNTFAYNNHEKEIVKTCENAFDDAGKSAKYVIKGEMDGDSCELIFVFDKKVDAASLKEGVKNALTASFKNASVNVSASTEVAKATLAKHFLLRAAIATALIALLAFAYVAVRYASVGAGVAVGGSVLISMLLTAGLLVLTRIPVTVSTTAVVVLSGLLTAASALLTLGKVRAAKKENGEESNENRVLSAISAKETVCICGGLAGAMLFVGILGRTAAAWFAVASFVSIVVAAAISLFYAPALYLSLLEMKGENKSNYVGAKKKEKKASAQAEVAETPVEETEETPVEETEEAPVEETEEAPVQEE